MGYSTRFSLKREYELFVEHEIEEYKDRVSRSAILKIADEAAQRLHAQEQVTLNELVLWIEVDRIIAARLRLPAYSTWARKRRKQLEALRKPEAWGLRPDAPIVRNLPADAHGHVLVAHASHERAALFLAANGCTVTALESEQDIVDRVMETAEAHGLAARVHGEVAALDAWAPTSPLTAVICTPTAFAGLTLEQRARVLAVLQGATRDGGVHLVETIAAGREAHLGLEELRAAYGAGWKVKVEPSAGRSEQTFIARKV